MVDKNAKLSSVLNKIADMKSEHFTKQIYGFKPHCKNSDSEKFKMIGNVPRNIEEIRQYKAMNNSNIFDINTEIRNLHTDSLELVERLPNKARIDNLAVKLKKDISGPYFDEQKSDYRSSIKDDDELVYNMVTASEYDVI